VDFRENLFYEVLNKGKNKEKERNQGNGSPWPPVLSRWLAWVLLYLFIEVVMNSLMEGAFTSVYIAGLVAHTVSPSDVIPY
jgi:hypothetical protein